MAQGKGWHMNAEWRNGQSSFRAPFSIGHQNPHLDFSQNFEARWSRIRTFILLKSTRSLHHRCRMASEIYNTTCNCCHIVQDFIFSLHYKFTQWHGVFDNRKFHSLFSNLFKLISQESIRAWYYKMISVCMSLCHHTLKWHDTLCHLTMYYYGSDVMIIIIIISVYDCIIAIAIVIVFVIVIIIVIVIVIIITILPLSFPDWHWGNYTTAHRFRLSEQHHRTI